MNEPGPHDPGLLGSSGAGGLYVASSQAEDMMPTAERRIITDVDESVIVGPRIRDCRAADP